MGFDRTRVLVSSALGRCPAGGSFVMLSSSFVSRISIVLGLSFALAACSRSSDTDSSKSDKSASSKSTEKDDKKSAGGGSGGGPATDNTGGVAVPSDPLVDYPTVFASCDAA